jgi:hypothetical protein
MVRTFPKGTKTLIQETLILPSDAERRCSRIQDCVRILSRIGQRDHADKAALLLADSPSCLYANVAVVICTGVRADNN